jgi:pyruvate dehydrogenase E2 component (dihydrolipoamide acetyltransferase)
MDVRLPKLGENAEGGSVVTILVKEGDVITKGQTILELEDEKAVAPIPSTEEGVITQIRVKEGDRIGVGQVILTVSPKGTGAQAPAQAPVAAAPAAPAAARSVPPATDRVSSPPSTSPARPPAAGGEPAPILEEPDPKSPAPAASPELRRIARELGLDLRRIRGSERGGRIVFADIRAYLQQLQRLASAPKPVPAPGPAGSSTAAAPVESIDFSKWGPVTRKPMSVLRRTISRRMVENWNTIPHVTQFDDVDITDLMELRKKFAPEYERRGARLTLTSFALKAVVAALQKHPVLNSSIDEATQEIVTKSYYHIGLAVDTAQGLIVPVLRDVDRKSLLDLSKEITTLADKARDRKLSLEELKGGTFTISNQGGIGGAHFTPIINKPEVAILGLGKGALRPVVRDKTIEPRLLMPIALSYDHRLIDGGTAARFTVDLAAAFTSFKEPDVTL